MLQPKGPMLEDQGHPCKGHMQALITFVHMHTVKDRFIEAFCGFSNGMRLHINDMHDVCR